MITGTEVRMRQSGNTNAKIIDYFKKGEKVLIREAKDGWFKVERFNGSVGWVSGQFCKEERK